MFDVSAYHLETDGDFDRYRVATRSGDVPKVQQDVNRIVLVREKGLWKVLSGL